MQPRSACDPLQQPQHILGREITANEHHRIDLAPAH
jgi:hypothetical protein